MAETSLLITLEEYAKQLETHLGLLRERRQELETVWFRLRDIYEGEAAQAFTEAFETANTRLAEYSELSDAVSRRLREKIADLRRFEREQDPAL